VPPTLADRVRHILAAIENIERFLAGKTQQDYADDHFLQLATERLLEIICEASRHIPENVRSCEPGIPWTRMVDFGNRLRHALSSGRFSNSLERRCKRPPAAESLRPTGNARRRLRSDV
jgi:uncharacterized protein with HEPN domain